MKTNKWKAAIAAILTGFCMINLCDVAYAAEGYTTITVEATDDESGVYMYAIDSTEDSAWQTSNTFYVEPDTLHTVYVKDAAGNITSSEVFAESTEVINYEDTYALPEDETESEIYEEDPFEAGVGTGDGVGTVTDYSDDSSKEYYTITTKTGNSFYLIIDHRNNDSNVYFTKPVSELDLLTLAAEAGDVEESALEQKQKEEIPVLEPEEESNDGKGSSLTEYLPMILFIGVLCGGYYYFMIYKKKKAAMETYDEDAADMDQFIPVEDDDDAALFAYKGNRMPEAEEENMDDIIDEFYENNQEIDEPYEEAEEDYDSGTIDEDYDNDVVLPEEDDSENEYDDTDTYDDQEEDGI